MAHFILCGALLRAGDPYAGLIVLFLDFPASLLFMHLGLLGFVIGGSLWWFFLAALMTIFIPRAFRAVLRFLNPVPGGFSGNEPAISEVFVPTGAVPHVIWALEEEIARQHQTSTLPEESQPADFDRNDVALFESVLSEVRESASASGAFITYPWSKPVQFSAATVGQYVSRNRGGLRADEVLALEQLVSDVRACKWRPNAAPPIGEST